MVFLSTFREFLENVCYTLNFFKMPFTLHFSAKRRLISNKLGTILSVVILLYLSYEIVNSNMYEKANPAIINQKIFPSTRPKIKYNKSNFEFCFGLFDQNMTNQTIDETIYEISLTQVKRTIEFNDSLNISTLASKKIEYKNFHLSNASDLSLSKFNPIYSQMLCLDNIDLETLGFVNEQEFSFFKLELKFCNEQTNGKTCQSKEKMLENIKDKSLGIHFIDNNLNFNNFSDPIAFTAQAPYINLDPWYRKEISMFLSEFELLDDYNIFKKDPEKTKGFTKISTSNEFVYHNDGNFTNEVIARFLFYSSQEAFQHMRTYQKLSELLSNIGGSASLFISIGFIFMNVINEWTL